MLRRLLGILLLERALHNAQAWKQIAERNEEFTHTVARFAAEQHNLEMLALERSMLDMAVQWRISMEQPENDIRDDIDKIIRALSDEIARREEHVA